MSPGRARDHPVMENVPNKARALSLSLSLSALTFILLVGTVGMRDQPSNGRAVGKKNINTRWSE